MPGPGGREAVSIVRTNAGMCAVWQPDSFGRMDDFEIWEDWATENENIEESIREGIFVPLNVGGDGVFQVVVRYGEVSPQLTGDESQFKLASSKPYLLISKGFFVVGGIEDVSDREYVAEKQLSLESGRYSVVVNLIDWRADPNSVAPDGRPSERALPDFVVLVSPEKDGAAEYRAESTHSRGLSILR